MENPTRRRLLTLLLAGALTVTAPLALTGCAIAEGVIEQTTGGDVDLPGTDIPEDFPDVPLADGEVLTAGGLGNADGKVWNVSVRVAEGAYDDIQTQLEDAGFALQAGNGATADGQGGTFVKDQLGVLVVVVKDADGWVANYTVGQGVANAG